MIIGDSMDYSTFIDEIVEKYGYQDNVRRAIEIAIPLMIKKYGEHRIEEVLNVFRDVEICTFTEKTPKAYETIKERMIEGINTHVNDLTGADYGPEDHVPGSTYTYHAILDENLHVVGEKRWIAVQAVEGYHQSKYEEKFGTNINIPYFLHELGHAFAMQNAVYKQDGNRIYSKHGFYETVDEISYEYGKPTIRTVQEEGLLLEDIVDEKMTKDQLMDFFGITTEKELKKIMDSLPFSTNVYGGVLHLLAEQLETRLGTENLLRWRVDNDMRIKDNFSSLCNGTEIASVYFPGEDAFSFFANKINEIYINNTLAQSFKISVEEYGRLNKLAMYDAMAVICAYREAIGERDFSFYDKQRKEAFPKETEVKPENKTI